MRLMVEERFKSYIQPKEFLFVDLDGSRVPFQVLDVEDGQHFVVSLESIATKDQSDDLAGKEIFIPVEAVKTRHLRSPRNLEGKWDGFTLINNSDEASYVVLRTEEYPQQLMAVILVGSREILIPLNDHLITSIDKTQKIIRMEMPDGLLEL